MPAQIDTSPGTEHEASAFAPTHLIHLSELPPSERETYFDLLISADCHFHKDYETGSVLADMRILGPGVRMPREEEAGGRGEEGPRLTPQEKLALQAAEAASVVSCNFSRFLHVLFVNDCCCVVFVRLFVFECLHFPLVWRMFCER